MAEEKVITTEQDIPAETLENLSNNKGLPGIIRLMSLTMLIQEAMYYLI